MKIAAAAAAVAAFASIVACVVTIAANRAPAWRPVAVSRAVSKAAAPAKERQPKVVPPARAPIQLQPAHRLSPRSASLPPATLSPFELRERLSQGAIVAFVGKRSYFDERHIPGAACVPYEDLESHFRATARDAEILLYCGCCGGASEGVSGAAARLLQEIGFSRVAHLEGHFAAWQSAGLPIEGTNPARLTPAPRETESQRRRLDAFAEESRLRRSELDAALAAERDTSRLKSLRDELASLDAALELEALQLKREIARENGDVSKVNQVDGMLETRRGTK